MGEPEWAEEARKLIKKKWGKRAIAKKLGIKRAELCRFIRKNTA